MSACICLLKPSTHNIVMTALDFYFERTWDCLRNVSVHFCDCVWEWETDLECEWHRHIEWDPRLNIKGKRRKLAAYQHLSPSASRIQVKCGNHAGTTSLLWCSLKLGGKAKQILPELFCQVPVTAMRKLIQPDLSIITAFSVWVTKPDADK